MSTSTQQPPPADVLAAIDRMSRPTWGVSDETIARDRESMAVIRAYVTGEPIKTPRELALERVARYVARRTGRRGLDHNEVHALDVGCDTEAVLLLTDLRELLAAADEATQ